MKEMPTDDKLFGRGSVRQDGRKIHPMYLLQVKTPAESKAPWDYYKVRATIPENEAFRLRIQFRKSNVSRDELIDTLRGLLEALEQDQRSSPEGDSAKPAVA